MRIIGIIATTVILIISGNALEYFFGTNFFWNFDLFAGIIIGMFWYYLLTIVIIALMAKYTR